MEFLASDLKVDARQMKSGIQLVKNQDLKRVSFMFSDELVPLVVTVNNLAVITSYSIHYTKLYD